MEEIKLKEKKKQVEENFHLTQNMFFIKVMIFYLNMYIIRI